MSNRFYKIVKIEGKNLGCIALRDIQEGSLILQEKPQCIANWSDPEYTRIGVSSLIASYNKMNSSDQEEYLKLYNRFNKDQEKKRQSQLKEWLVTNKIPINSELGIERAINIIGIYDTNCFQRGVGIQTSRFNHSCCSNSEAIWNDEENIREIRAVNKIKAGEEITINYSWKQVSMKNLKARQEFLLSNWGFKCCCDICQDEETTTDNENYEHFERLKLQTEKLRKVSNTPGSFRLTLIKKEVVCHKEMLKLAKEKRTSKAFIVNEILDSGFNAAVQGYLDAQVSFNYVAAEEFEKECELFSNLGEKMSKVVFGNTYVGKEWNERKHNFENYIKEDMIDKHFQLHSNR